MHKCIVMFSGGLDSTIAVHLLQQQNIDVLALHFILPFRVGFGLTHGAINEAAEYLKVPLMVVEEGEEFLSMVRDPHFGYGKNANPCLDCRIHRLTKAAAIMRECGAEFIATGEVLGQRPMSQRRDCLYTVVKRSGLEGLLLRPLSALHLNPTIPEEKGWVDRTKLLAIGGRGRSAQLAYARQYGLRYSTPGGGCQLTVSQIGNRFHDLRDHLPDFGLTDFKLLAYGRHFRLSPRVRLIVSRRDSENIFIYSLRQPGDRVLTMADTPGPVAVLRGAAEESQVLEAAAIISRYCRERGKAQANVTIATGDTSIVVTVSPATAEECAARMIGAPENMAD
jgi:tRNA-specific 2-thiouridylase